MAVGKTRLFVYIWGSLALAIYMYMGYVLQFRNEILASNITSMLDLRVFWTRRNALTLLDTLSVGDGEGLAALDRYYLLDCCFPFFYAPVLSCMWALYLKIVPGEGLPTNSKAPFGRRVIAGLPLIGGVFDLAENVFIKFLIHLYSTLPRQNPPPFGKSFCWIGGFLTLAKWNFIVFLPFLVGYFEWGPQAKRRDEMEFRKAIARGKNKEK